MIKTTEKAFVILIVSILALMAICFAESQESYADAGKPAAQSSHHNL
jgi:hypothetical protein